MLKLTIFSAAVLLLNVSLSANTVKYFKSYRISDWDYSVIPEDSLSEAEALESVCNKFTYNDRDELIQIEGFAYGLNFLDTHEKVNKIIFESENKSIIKTFFDENNKPMRNNKKGVFGEEILKQDNGFQLYFLAEKGERTTNYHNIFLIAYHVDQRNNFVEQKYYDIDKNPVKNNLGVYKIRKKFNHKQQIVEARYYDKFNKLSRNIANFAIVKLEYNNNGDVIEKRYFDVNGKPVSTFPVKISVERKVGKKWKYFSKNNEPVLKKFPDLLNLTNADPINYNLVVKLSSRDLLLNYLSVATWASSMFPHLINIDQNILESLRIEYYRRWHSILDSLKNKKLIFKNGYAFSHFTSSNKANQLLANKIVKMDSDSLKAELRQLFLLNNTKNCSLLNQYLEPATRFCYGQLKVNEIVFFKWQDILFCVNPYYRRYAIDKRDKVAIDFEKIPISGKIKHVFFEGVTINNCSPHTYYGNTKFYFNHCIVNFGSPVNTKYLVEPKEIANKQLIYYKKPEFTYTHCSFDTLELNLWDKNSDWPKLFYSSYKHLFYQCEINTGIIWAGKSYDTPVAQSIENHIEFIRCDVKKLDISGDFTSLVFEDTKVNDFYATYVNLIERELKFINSSFESPLNLPNLILPDSANFGMINTSYQGYMKFPWAQLKGRVELSINKAHLKTYGNLYNLLSSNYKTLSLIKDADECYFYWKQFERKSFWELYWKEPNTHWYNPFDVAKAIGLMIFNTVNYFSCGYGVKPLWIFPFTLFIVCFFALIYFFMPTQISSLEEHLIAKDKIAEKLRSMDIEKIKEIFKNDDFNFRIKKQSLIEDIISSIGTDELLAKLKLQPESRYNFDFFWYCFYFSFSTFTTIGIGDWYPSGKLNKALVMIEGALGWLCLGLFITTYANILLR